MHKNIVTDQGPESMTAFPPAHHNQPEQPKQSFSTFRAILQGQQTISEHSWNSEEHSGKENTETVRARVKLEEMQDLYQFCENELEQLKIRLSVLKGRVQS